MSSAKTPATARVARPLVFGGLGLLTLVGLMVGLGWGAVAIEPSQVIAIVLHHLGVDPAGAAAYTSQQDAVLWSIRLPRVLFALLAGTGLALSGLALQAVLRNPLADPALLGMTGGATLGVVTLIASVGLVARWLHPVAGVVGALLVGLWLHRISRRGGSSDTVTLILAGVALQILLAAVVTIVISMARRPGLPDANFWTLGGLSGARWQDVWIAAPVVVVVLLLLWRLGPRLDLFLLGESEARHLGVNTTTTGLQVMVLVALLIGVVVAYCGSIAFVGLVVPHLLRTLLGPNHKTLVWASALGGAALLTWADAVARNAISPLELPLGVLVTLVGGPLFFYLIARSRRAGAW